MDFHKFCLISYKARLSLRATLLFAMFHIDCIHSSAENSIRALPIQQLLWLYSTGWQRK